MTHHLWRKKGEPESFMSLIHNQGWFQFRVNVDQSLIIRPTENIYWESETHLLNWYFVGVCWLRVWYRFCITADSKSVSDLPWFCTKLWYRIFSWCRFEHVWSWAAQPEIAFQMGADYGGGYEILVPKVVKCKCWISVWTLVFPVQNSWALFSHNLMKWPVSFWIRDIFWYSLYKSD